MPHYKKIELIFYRVDPSEENKGMKQVLFKVTKRKVYDNYPDEGRMEPDEEITYDFGYADWLGREWDKLPEVPEDWDIEVHSWANNPDPKHLIEESKLIKL